MRFLWELKQARTECLTTLGQSICKDLERVPKSQTPTPTPKTQTHFGLWHIYDTDNIAKVVAYDISSLTVVSQPQYSAIKLAA